MTTRRLSLPAPLLGTGWLGLLFSRLLASPLGFLGWRVAVKLLLSFTVAVALLPRPCAGDPVLTIRQNALYLPQQGVALAAADGRVLWRYPRLHTADADGSAWSNGGELLLINYPNPQLPLIIPSLHFRSQHLCRVNVASGRDLWCRDVAHFQRWAVDARGAFLYVLTLDHLQVLDLRNGRTYKNWKLLQAGDYEMHALPAGGVLLLLVSYGRTQAVRYDAAFKQPPQLVTLPAPVHAFSSGERADTAIGAQHKPGVLLYAARLGEFLGPALFRPVLRLSHVVGDYPRATVSGNAFAISDWQQTHPVVRWGRIDGPVWNTQELGSSSGLVLDQDAAFVAEVSRHPESAAPPATASVAVHPLMAGGAASPAAPAIARSTAEVDAPHAAAAAPDPTAQAAASSSTANAALATAPSAPTPAVSPQPSPEEIQACQNSTAEFAITCTRMAALSLNSGKAQWEALVRGHLRLIAASQGLLLASDDHGLVVLNAADGRLRWRTSQPLEPAALTRDAVVVWTAQRDLEGLRAEDGALLWHIHFRLSQ